MANELVDAFIQAIILIITLDSEVLDITFLSLRISLISVLLATMIGIPSGIIVGSRKFKGKQIIQVIINTGMSFPPVVMGLFIFLIFSNNTLFGIQILLTETVMMLAQLLLALPIIIGLSSSAVAGVDETLKETAITLGASSGDIIWMQVREVRVEIVAGIIVAFGGAISEIGAVQIVGGNIRFRTRTLTTAIGKDISAGRFEFALALGIILLATAFAVNLLFTYIQHSNVPKFLRAD